VAYSDPTGFYLSIEGGTARDQATAAGDAEVVRGWAQQSADYWSKQSGSDAQKKAAAFQKLADDMTKGKGDLTINIYSDNASSKSGYVNLGDTRNVFVNFASSDRQGTLATEAFNARFQGEDSPYYGAMQATIKQGAKGNDEDYFVDQLVNQFFRGQGGKPPSVLPYEGDNG